jgi:hypothetical protein
MNNINNLAVDEQKKLEQQAQQVNNLENEVKSGNHLFQTQSVEILDGITNMFQQNGLNTGNQAGEKVFSTIMNFLQGVMQMAMPNGKIAGKENPLDGKEPGSSFSSSSSSDSSALPAEEVVNSTMAPSEKMNMDHSMHSADDHAKEMSVDANNPEIMGDSEAATSSANMSGMDHSNVSADEMGHSEDEHAAMGHSMPARESNEVLTDAPRAPQEVYDALSNKIDDDGTIELLDRTFIDGGHTGHTGHTGPEMGHALDIDDTMAAAAAMGMDGLSFLNEYTQDESKYSAAKTDDLKMAGALTVLNDAVAAKTLGDALYMDNDKLSKVAGDATIAAIAGDGAKVREILDDVGANTAPLSDNMLAQIWGTNSHMYNHATLNYKGPDFGLTHIRSLNDNADDGTERGTLGFYNDKGEWPEWDSHENSRKFMERYFA